MNESEVLQNRLKSLFKEMLLVNRQIDQLEFDYSSLDLNDRTDRRKAQRLDEKKEKLNQKTLKIEKEGVEIELRLRELGVKEDGEGTLSDRDPD